MEAIAIQKKSEKTPRQTVPKVPAALVYEIASGKPIYYKGYKDVLNKTKTIEEITMESQLQAGLKAGLSAVLYFLLKNLGYQLATGELGIIISKAGKRGADLAIYKAENWEWKPNFSNLPPEVVIEIDVQAELEGISEMDYISSKIKDYTEFGVKKVIWIFTKQQLIFVATAKLPWLTYDWSAEIEVVEGVSFKLDDMIKVA
jgi:Uma2 family endonuclease